MNRLEREAESIAAEILQGGRDVGRRIHFGPAAAFRAKGSIGRPLEPGLRRDMETAFNADLSAVRVHTDGLADLAAAGFDAEALASGARIYFRSGRYSPGHRGLLAHELVHVLQQTGRRGPKGTLVAGDFQGPAAPQCARKSPLPTSREIPDLDRIIAYHKKASPNDEQLKKRLIYLKADKALHEKNKTLDTYLAELEKKVLAGDPAYDENLVSSATRGLIFDCLKYGKRWDGAARLLSRDTYLQTTFYSAEVYERLPEGSDESSEPFDRFLTRNWAQDPFFKVFSAERFLNLFRDYLFGPTRSIANLNPKYDTRDSKTDFAAIARAKLEEANEPAGLIPNELFFVTVHALMEADRARRETLARFAARAAPRKSVNELLPEHRALVGGMVEKWARSLFQDPSLASTYGREAAYLLGSVDKAIASIGGLAVTFWGAAPMFEGLLVSDTRFPGINPREIIRKIGTRPEIGAFRDLLFENAQNLFRLSSDGLPQSSDAYAAARNQFVARLKKSVFASFEREMLKALQGGKPEEKDTVFRAMAYAWLIIRTNKLVATLQQYDPAQDARIAAEYRQDAPDYPGADVRVRHRLLVADDLYAFAVPFGWQPLRKVLRLVAVPEQKSLLAIFGDWDKDDGPLALDRLTRDFGASHQMTGLWPLTAGQIQDFFLLNRFQAISGNLTTALKNEAAKPGSEPFGIVLRAVNGVAKLPVPKRFSTKTFHAAVKEGQQDYSDLVLQHPRVRALKKAEQFTDPVTGRRLTPALATPVQYQPEELVVWVIPHLAELIRRFRRVSAFNVLVYQHRNPAAGPVAANDPRLAEVDDLVWYQWWKDLREALDAVGKKDPKELLRILKAGQPVGEALHLELDQTTARTNDLLRQASIIDRTRRVREYLQPLWGEYLRFKQFEKSERFGVLRYRIPELVLQGIIELSGATAPLKEQPLHEAVILLELADILAEKLKVENAPRLDVIVSYVPLMDAAVKAVTESKPALLTVLNAEQKADPQWLDRQSKKLSELAAALREIEREQAEKFGMEGVIDGTHKHLAGLGQGYYIEPKSPGAEDEVFSFTINGIDYVLLDILTPFTFHPPYGTEKSSRVLGQDGKPLPASTPLLRIRYGEGSPVTLTPKHESALIDLSLAVTLEGIIRQLNGLAKFIKGAAELTMDLVELIPGAGQALMAARLAVSIIQFLVSEEFKVLVNFVVNNPFDALRETAEDIKKLLKPGDLWDYLLTGNNAFDRLHVSKPQSTKVKRPKTKAEKLERIILRVFSFGKGVLGSMGRLQTRVRRQNEGLEVLVLSHPTLAWVLRLVSDHIDRLAALSRSAHLASGDVADYERRLEEAMAEWPDKIVGILDELKTMELPDDLIPVVDILDIIIAMILERLPLKFRIVGKVIMFLLEKFNRKEALLSGAAEGIKAIGLDPNKAWLSLRDQYIVEPFKEARDGFAGSVFGVLEKVDLFSQKDRGGFSSRKGSVTDQEFKTAPMSAELWPFSSGPTPRGPLRGHLPASPGAPLPGAPRQRAERTFGQDLSHVRLHTGPAAHALTGSAKAEALTGGSHIFFRRGFNPGSPRDSWVLNHELAHVVQQSAPRPVPGGQHSSTPSPVPKGSGIVRHPAREREASIAATAAMHGHSSNVGPGSAAAGWHPISLVDVTRRFLDNLAGTSDIEKDEAKEEKTGAGTGLKKLPANVAKQIDALWTGFESSLKTATYTKPFGEVKEDVVRHLTTQTESTTESGGAAKAIREALGDLANDSLDETKIPASKTNAADRYVYSLNVDRFEVALARFIFAKAGILIKFDLIPGVGEDTPPRFGHAKIVYVHLAEIHGQNNLWKKAVSLVLATKDQKERARYLPRIRAYLAGKGPTIGIWDSTRYQLNAGVIKEVEEIMAASEKTLDAQKLPPPSVYLAEKSPAGTTEHIGLRRGTYVDGQGQQKGPERESHHITQYLLIEYFHGKSDDSPFPLLKKNLQAYPGVSATGTGGDVRINEVSAKSSKPIHLKEFEAQRGGKMPAILLATPTHRTGRLHVTTKADDWTQGGNPATAIDSPSAVVNYKFRDFIGTRDQQYVNKESGGDQSAFAGYVKATGRDKVATVIFEAMQDTYHWMRDYMQPRLRDALTTIEKKYYNDLAQAKGQSERIGDTELLGVYAAAVLKNETEMTKGGWKP